MSQAKNVWLVTGGTRGIGAATAIAFAEQGAKVALAARHLDEEAMATRRTVEAFGSPCALILADVSIADEAMRCVQSAAGQFGGVDVLVHSAGSPANWGLLGLKSERLTAALAAH